MVRMALLNTNATYAKAHHGLGTVGMAQHAQRQKMGKELTAYVCSGVGTVATNQEQGNDVQSIRRNRTKSSKKKGESDGEGSRMIVEDGPFIKRYPSPITGAAKCSASCASSDQQHSPICAGIPVTISLSICQFEITLTTAS
jgi:hypothetical protein